MKKDCLVILFGDSLLMDTVEASLSDSPEFGIIRFHTTVSNVAERLQTLCPDLVVFDINSPIAQFALSFLKEQPSVPLLGLDVTCSKVVSLSCEHHAVLTADDLADVILHKISGHNGSSEHSQALLDARSRNLSVLNHAKALRAEKERQNHAC